MINRFNSRTVLSARVAIAISLAIGLAASTVTMAQNPDAASKTPMPPRPPGTITNGLGMIFVPVGDVLVSIWETRVQDFEAFADTAGYDATEGAQINGVRRDEARRFNWRQPGFPQSSGHAVCLVSWEDADAFCRWLTDLEHKDGTLEAGRIYRLPTEPEWNEALGSATRFPWGDDWPPPEKFGNYGGQEARVANWPRDWKGLPDYRDGFPRTSPVGSFAPNDRGIFDLSGNVWEFCQDWHRPDTNAANFAQQNGHAKPGQGQQTYRRVRGGGWVSYTERMLMSDMRRNEMPHMRYDTTGFRCVIAPDDGQRRDRRLKLRMTAGTNRGLTNALVEVAVTLNGRGRTRWSLRTDAEGRCSVALTAESPGTIAFTVATDGFVPRETILLDDENLQTEQKVTLAPAIAVGGVIRDEAGKPVSDARVELMGAFQVETSNWVPDYSVRAQTDADGRWTSSRLPADWTRLRIAVNKEGYAQATYNILPGGVESIVRSALLATNAVLTLQR